MKTRAAGIIRQGLLFASSTILILWFSAGLYSLAWKTRATGPWSIAWYGSGRPLLASATAVLLSLVFGVWFGILSVRGSGTGDRVIRRTLAMIGSLPTVLVVGILLAILPSYPAIALGTGIGVARLTEVALLVRVHAIRFRASPAFEASKSTGSSPLLLAWMHLVPRLVAPVSQSTVLSIASVTVVDAAIRYIHLTMPGPTPSWGEVIAMAASSSHWSSAGPSLLAATSTAAAALILTTFRREARDKHLQESLPPCVSRR